MKVIRIHEISRFERFLPVQLVEEITNDNISLETGGKSGDGSILFSDILDFRKKIILFL